METFNFFFMVASLAIITYEVVLHTNWFSTTPQSLPKSTLDLFRKDLDIIPYGRIEWCKGDTSSGRVCNIRNMCYSHFNGYFVLVTGNNSILNQNVPQHFMVREDIVTIGSPSSKYFSFSYAEVSSQYVRNKKFLFKNYQEGKYFMYYSFVSHNIMHTIHDDLLPLFNTLKLYENFTDKAPRTLILLTKGPIYDDFINIFSKYPLISKNDLSYEPRESLTCFEDMTIGVSRETLWYQYGLDDEPEGPIANSKLKVEHIKNFKTYVQNAFGILPVCANISYGVFFSRKETRLILNENELIKSVATSFNIEVRKLSMEHNTISEIVESVLCAKFAIGVHGAILIFAMFLPQSSLLLEMYPFAMNPNAYTPYKTLTAVPGMDIEYLSWRNTDISKTVTHPTNHPIAGGIAHLSKEEQERILQSTEVPPHLCCYDPEFRFRLNQDTLVDIKEIISLLRTSSTFKMIES